MRAVQGWHLLAQDPQGAPAQPSPPQGICLGGPVVSQLTRWGINCDLNPDKASGILPVVGKSLASVQKRVCPRCRSLSGITERKKAKQEEMVEATSLSSRQAGKGDVARAPAAQDPASLRPGADPGVFGWLSFLQVGRGCLSHTRVRVCSAVLSSLLKWHRQLCQLSSHPF